MRARERECEEEVAKTGGGERGEKETLGMGGRRENRALDISRVAISVSCVSSGGFYAGMFIYFIPSQETGSGVAQHFEKRRRFQLHFLQISDAIHHPSSPVSYILRWQNEFTVTLNSSLKKCHKFKFIFKFKKYC